MDRDKYGLGVSQYYQEYPLLRQTIVMRGKPLPSLPNFDFPYLPTRMNSILTLKKTALSLLIASIALVSPAIGHEGDHGPDENTLDHSVLTGNGRNTYKTHPNWAQFPDGKPIGSTHGGVAVDKSGRIYVSTQAERGICVFRPNGKFIKSIALDCIGTHSLTIRNEKGKEYLYGAHVKGERIVKLDLKGNIVLEIANTEAQPIPGTLKGVTAVTVGPDGRIYAAVGYGSNLIHIFSPEGKLLKTFGSKGTDEDQTKTCHGISIDNRFGEPRLLVSDRENHRLKHYDLEGNQIGIHATNLRRPCAVSFFGDYCAVAELAGRVTILDKTGTPVAFLGDNPIEEQRAGFKTEIRDIPAGVFTAPHGLSYDKSGNLYVQDWNATGRINKLTLVKH